jgi:hypothetical protein
MHLIYYFGSAEGHEYLVLHRLCDNSISEQKDYKKKAFKTFKSEK